MILYKPKERTTEEIEAYFKSCERKKIVEIYRKFKDLLTLKAGNNDR